MGAPVVFAGLLCLWREWGHHHLPGDGMQAHLPSPLCHGGRLHHPVLWTLQVLLLGAPPRAGSGGSSGGGHCVPHLSGPCGGQEVL
ncbi:hypothetical protein llap_18299 [Limosa lapponica baueri]|uniref:Uncharacterized protein n=1 Tax=Limosa lapponica baueri TaxID=1758121 RepID=A0A2I0TC87_LIMLA|nr:hypothetical protein llap_18299 [Limosa lapponica baueri]